MCNMTHLSLICALRYSYENSKPKGLGRSAHIIVRSILIIYLSDKSYPFLPDVLNAFTHF